MSERGMVPKPICESCNADLEEAYKKAIQAKDCHLQGIICGFPCGRCEEAFNPDAQKCQTMVPLGKLEDPNKPRGRKSS